MRSQDWSAKFQVFSFCKEKNNDWQKFSRFWSFIIKQIVNICRLNKSQIDKAAKDKQCKTFGEKFNVTLFFTKPTDQSDNLVDYSMLQVICVHIPYVLSQSLCRNNTPTRKIEILSFSIVFYDAVVKLKPK
jgi:hypothetical protein